MCKNLSNFVSLPWKLDNLVGEEGPNTSSQIIDFGNPENSLVKIKGKGAYSN